MSQSNSLNRRGFFKAGLAGLALAGSSQITTAAHAAAPKKGPAGGQFHRFNLGGFEVTTLRDGSFSVDTVQGIFGQDQQLSAVETLAHENHLPKNRMTIGFAPVLVNTGSELVLFDTGNAPGRRPGAGHLVHALEASGISAGDVDVVVITHMHGDHIGGMLKDGKAAFPNARYVTGQVEYDFWTHPDRFAGETESRAQLVKDNVARFADRMTFLNGGGAVASGIEAVEAFGHTPGHMAFHIESNGQRLMLCGDAANHPVFSLQRPDWHVKFDMDKAAAAATRKKLFGMVAADRIGFTGYHMPFPAVGFVDTKDQGFRYVPASYQFS
ncbi:MBL fold metallo-hydrolase [Kiloniella sp. b19]|uniref:MBL fold metallo-hydrolase n=1 Tax=Kiloniella sp. GXU_MW_B19 TaxID=3141326 RepID=UPI0031DCC21F